MAQVWHGGPARSRQQQKPKGTGLNFANEVRHNGPRKEAIMLWAPKNVSLQVNCNVAHQILALSRALVATTGSWMI